MSSDPPGDGLRLVERAPADDEGRLGLAVVDAKIGLVGHGLLDVANGSSNDSRTIGMASRVSCAVTMYS
ncbi:MAG: hypothetical protein ABL983_12590 [Nitrospira sp.]